ncbi:hypothetical protein WH87_04765 [Devosia epidermidihirudinis]|uniref:Uncharacterized protein n=1 Tax=Devosia epidermidihirudinis TaxID=1293439 RepID=A0A0F5QEW8_9HYPH|nr:hypothetical protein [Devosia epidermidihirudinis]KKC39510.1 hypothetical protein WH87_04765 [Devosia epidermidihirudinis]
MADNVTPLFSGPAVADIPGQLRQMAEMIERGEVLATSALFIVPQNNDWPMVFGWGDHLGDLGNIAVCELTKSWFVNNLTAWS